MTIGIRRRDFLGSLGSAAAMAWPLPALAQKRGRSLPVIGFLNNASPKAYAGRVRAFHEGLKERGFEEGKNVLVEYRWANGDYKRLPDMAKDLVDRRVNVIAATGGTVSGVTAKKATTTIPIVFALAVDPIAAGIVKSLNRPEGNLTGIGTMAAQLAPKRLELLHEIVPNASSFGLMFNPTNPNFTSLKTEMEHAVRTLKVDAREFLASRLSELEGVFSKAKQEQVGGLVVGPDGFFNIRSPEIAALGLRHNVPTVYQYREFAAAGGLMSYGGSVIEPYRQAGVYTGRILKGEKPSDLPVQQSTKVELVINLGTAKALGLTFPLSLLGRADEVIE
jgi:putative ABC transport system substrate-binding protein